MRARSILITALAAVVVLVVGGFIVHAVVTDGPDSAPPLHGATATPHSTDNATPTPHATSTARPKASIGPTGPDLSAFTDYAALGDSYAAGVGAGPELDLCQRTDAGYPELLASDGAVLQVNVACGGATTDDVRTLQLGELGPDTDLVTVTIGGNDLDAIGLAINCAKGADHACQSQFTKSLKTLKRMPTRLLATYADIATAAPNARILVTGYPDLFELPAATDPAFSTIAVINAATDSLNNMIKKAVSRVQDAGANISYVGVSFAGHGIGAHDPWINAAGSAGAFHPTEEGYLAYENAIVAALSK